MDPTTVDELRSRLQRLYPDDVAERTLTRLVRSLDRFRLDHPHVADAARRPFDETDVWIIAYGDHVTEPEQNPLATLEDFVTDHLGDVLGGIHLLPHYPATSDGGFAVVDYEEVDPRLGDWGDVERLAGRFRVMLDAVVNHTSASSPWFRGWLRDDPEYADFYISPPPTADLDQVVRPRTTPLLTPFDATDGVRHVWTTFGPDQVDLNYANPEVLLRVTEILLGYVARGASALRLDAIAFLWKRWGTSCIHLSETHEVIRVWRTVVDAVAPGTLVVTETNVPHEENLSYFGDGTNEAHVVYQFPLPPLVLHTFRRQDASVLHDWLDSVATPSASTTFLNFLSSHDGIGLRPVEGLIPADEIDALGAAIEAEGGGVSYRTAPGGRRFPYELNVSYFDALNPPTSPEPLPQQVDRFVAAQSLLLALAGIPAVYLHSILGSRNWVEGSRSSGHPRDINREKLTRRDVDAALEEPTSRRSQVFGRLRARIAARIEEPAFHPAARQRLLPTGPGLLAVERTAAHDRSTVLCVHNVTGRPQRLQLDPADGAPPSGSLVELASRRRIEATGAGGLDLTVQPYEVLWLRREPIP